MSKASFKSQYSDKGTGSKLSALISRGLSRKIAEEKLKLEQKRRDALQKAEK